MDFGKRLKELRQKRGMTLRQVAEAVGVSEATVQRYEIGEIRAPRGDRIRQIAHALGVDEATLLGIEEEPMDMEIRILARDIQQLPKNRRDKLVSAVRILIDDND